MAERPILFSAPMVRAILAGRKTVTRRVVRNIPWLPGVNEKFSQARSFRNGGVFHIAGSLEMTKGFRCPYGQVGDRLWVRETAMREPHPSESGLTREDIPRTWDMACEAAGTIHYLADLADGDKSWVADGRRWTPSIHMPKAWSRIWLEVTAVRVERLQDIREWEAMNEGAPLGHDESRVGDPTVVAMHRIGFQRLWDRLAKQGSTWADNPWVWVVEFRRIELPQDRAGETGSHGTACGHVAPGASQGSEGYGIHSGEPGQHQHEAQAAAKGQRPQTNDVEEVPHGG